MLLPGKNCLKILLFLMVLVTFVVANSEESDSQKIDIKLGFDLTQGSNGAPILRIRDFQDSQEVKPRSMKHEKKDIKRTLDSSESSDSVSVADEKPSKKIRDEPEVKIKKSDEEKSEEEDEEEWEGGLRSKVSTRGIPANDADGEEYALRRRRRRDVRSDHTA